MTTGPANGVVQLVDLDERHQFDSLHDQLSDAVAALEHDRGVQIVIDQADLDLAPVSGIDGSWGIDHGESRLGRQPGARMHQPDGSERECDRYSGPHQDSLTRLDGDRSRDAQIDACITLVRTCGYR